MFIIGYGVFATKDFEKGDFLHLFQILPDLKSAKRLKVNC